MSFRKFGGTHYAASNNFVKSNINNSRSLYVTQNVGQPNTYINFLSDISGNINIYGDVDISGNLHVQGDIDCSGNLYVKGTITNTATQPASNNSSTIVPTTAWVQGAIAAGGSSQWTTTVGGIYYNSGNVGIGTTTPAYKLDVSGNLYVKEDAIINSLTVGRGGNSVYSNTAFGENTLLANTTGANNTAIGNQAVRHNTIGTYNTAIGNFALHYNTTGGNNTAIGQASLEDNTTGGNNTAIGINSLQYNTTGGNNTAIGAGSLSNVSSLVNVDNTGIGFNVGSNNISGTQLTFVGSGTDTSGSSFSNSTAIGYTAQITASNQVRIGNSSVTSIGGYANWSNISDLRDKKNIEPLDAGLNFLEKVKPVRFDWNIRNGGKKDISEVGFIAQELLEIQKETGIIIPGLINDENPEQLFMTSSSIIPILVKAVQELSERVKILEQNR